MCEVNTQYLELANRVSALIMAKNSTQQQALRTRLSAIVLQKIQDATASLQKKHLYLHIAYASSIMPENLHMQDQWDTQETPDWESTDTATGSTQNNTTGTIDTTPDLREPSAVIPQQRLQEDAALSVWMTPEQAPFVARLWLTARLQDMYVHTVAIDHDYTADINNAWSYLGQAIREVLVYNDKWVLVWEANIAATSTSTTIDFARPVLIPTWTSYLYFKALPHQQRENALSFSNLWFTIRVTKATTDTNKEVQPSTTLIKSVKFSVQQTQPQTVSFVNTALVWNQTVSVDTALNNNMNHKLAILAVPVYGNKDMLLMMRSLMPTITIGWWATLTDVRISRIGYPSSFSQNDMINISNQDPVSYDLWWNPQYLTARPWTTMYFLVEGFLANVDKWSSARISLNQWQVTFSAWETFQEAIQTRPINPAPFSIERFLTY